MSAVTFASCPCQLSPAALDLPAPARRCEDQLGRMPWPHVTAGYDWNTCCRIDVIAIPASLMRVLSTSIHYDSSKSCVKLLLASVGITIFVKTAEGWPQACKNRRVLCRLQRTSGVRPSTPHWDRNSWGKNMAALVSSYHPADPPPCGMWNLI